MEQVERGNREDDDKVTFTELQRKSNEEKVVLKLDLSKDKGEKEKGEVGYNKFKFPTASSSLKVKLRDSDSESVRSSKSDPGCKKRKSALEEIREEEERNKIKKYRKDYWLQEVNYKS